MRMKLSADKVQLFSYFLFIAFAGSLVLSLPIAYRSAIPVPYIDALFISMSAICVTGLSTVNMDVFSPVGFVFIMLLIELGGLGIISFVSIYLIAPKRKVSLVNRSMISDFYVDDVEFDPRKIVRNIVFFTVSIEAVCAAVLYAGFEASGSSSPFLDAIFHSVSAFCNAGFSTYNSSLETFHSNYLVTGTVMFLIVSGGLGFIVLTDILDRGISRKRKLSLHSQVVLFFTGFLIVSSAFAFFFLERDASMQGFSFGDRIMAALFQAITPRTAGFDVAAQSGMTILSKLLTIVLMFIGGSPGSTAGGVKTTTFFIVFLYAIRGNTARNGLNVLKRNIETQAIEKAFSIVAKSIMIVALALTCLIVTERATLASGAHSVLDLFFETVSAFATVGLSLAVTPTLSAAGKIVIICTMFIGRTGVVAMALGFAHRENEQHYEYPTANIMLG
jgi:trk system potassium uptake protein TrkH